jgi:RecB family exonuclease
MGLLETRALDFKKVILVGANEGSLPKARRFDTFIPALIRSHYGLPTQKEEDAVFAYYFYRLLQYPSEVHITFGSEKNETGGGEMSRYLRQMIYGAPQSFGWRAEMKPLSAAVSTDDSGFPELIIQKSPEISKAIEKFMIKGVSVSRLNEFLRCPLDFYFKKLLGLKEKESLEEEVGSNELGDLVHEVLEDLFKERIGKGQLVKQDIQAMAKVHGELLTQKIKSKGLERIMESGESALTKAMAFKMLGNFFQREIVRIDEQRIEVIGIEEVKEYILDLVLGGTSIPVKFTAKIDRHDRVGEEHWILDYKTGKVDPKYLKLKSLEPVELFDPDHSKSLQLLYYTWLYWRATGILAKPGIISMLGMDTEPYTLTLDGRSDLKESDLLSFEELLKEKLVELYELESFQHDEEHGFYCDYCPVPAEKSF